MKLEFFGRYIKNIYMLYFSQRKLIGRDKGGKVLVKGKDLIGKGIK